MRSLAININDEYKIKIETGNEFKDSIFENVYSSAAKNLCDIISQSQNGNEHDSYNNIIAFTGERGKGKSSSMISFRNALLDYENKDRHYSFFNISEHEIIRKYKFSQIDIIDPSLFRGNESLFEIVIAKMFSKFQDIIKKENSLVTHDERREIIKLFQQVFDNMKIINSDKKDLYNLDSLEALSNLAYSSNLRDCFSRLVDKFLNVIEDKKSFLIISIDDFDLNIAKAYEMLEDIRHFLIQKRIILLIACKIEQLKDSIVNEIVKEYRYKLNLEQKTKIHNITSIDDRKFLRNERRFSSDVEFTNEYVLTELSNKAEKYIEKLIPFNHQIFIPSLAEFCDITFLSYNDSSSDNFLFFESLGETKNVDKEKSSIIYIGDSESLNNISLENLLESKNVILKEKLINEKNLFIEKNIYDCLLKLIFEKSNIFINKTDYRYHSIFPSTLRELNELIKVFNNENVLESFRKYILYKSINELPENLKKIYIEIDKQDFSFLNSQIINQLGNIKKTFEETNNTVIANGVNFDNHNPSFASIGEVFSKLNILYSKIKSTNGYWYKFLDYLSLYYSIRINQASIDKPKLLLEYCKGGLYDGEYKIFPVAAINLVNGKRSIYSRDWIEYKIDRKPGQSINAIFKSLAEIDAYWLAFFIQYFGNQDLYSGNNYPYFKRINQGGGTIYNLTFSPFAIFTNILFPVDVWYSIFTKDFDKENIIMKDLLLWKKDNKIQFLLLNPMFFNELVSNLSAFSTTAFKSANVPNYFETLYVYFGESLKKSIKSINEKYSYLSLKEDCFDLHPIKLHWSRIDKNPKLKKVMSDIFEAILKDEPIIKEKQKIVKVLLKEEPLKNSLLKDSSLKEEPLKEYSVTDLEFIKKKLNDYTSYLLDNSNERIRSLTYLVNSFENNPRIFEELSRIRFDVEKSVINKKTDVYNYLNNIVNGQSS